ncbi:Rab3 GTPase-activating protein regulatory subunit N-terminus-domain-containing protein [Jimgerdemannia flammicorona]|uniref:Rab3 GTPase-activating protein regulatory subunit N-terminus-domain-containing protein n=1 Tax=Jimgerdemannia flammicorona TaxID=994334 RepID=A0A433D8L8_9FUNG|nr:Rab3 GTPase-activating protein regulatory subunit N-terminus-domain-containing protein [Jimgerdemannia flammicorona]
MQGNDNGHLMLTVVRTINTEEVGFKSLSVCALFAYGQIFVLVGYSTGWIRFFTQSGVLLTSQLLDMSPVLAIKLRTPPPVIKLPPRTQAPATDDEEITILFDGGRVGQQDILDVVSCGPSTSSASHTTSGLPNSLTSYPFTSSATARYIAVGARPMLSYYTTNDSSRPLLSAVSAATMVVSKVTSAVFSFARSWWSGPSNLRPNLPAGDQPVPAQFIPAPPPVQIAPATPITSVLSLADSNRRILYILLSPPTISSARHPLAVTTDSLGRVMLLDIEEGEMIRMFKGVRGAVCGWVEVLEADLKSKQPNTNEDGDKKKEPRPSTHTTNHQRVLLFLVIHSPRRGIVEVYQMRHAHRVGIFHVGVGWRLVACGGEPLGSAYVGTERRRAAARLAEEKVGRQASGLATCLLVGPNGEIRRVEIEGS